MARNPIRESAVQKRDAALAEAQRWTDFIKMLDEIDPSPAKQAAEEAGIRAIARTIGENVQSVKRSVVRGALVMTEEAAIEEIKRLGRAIPSREMCDLLTARGIDIGGQDAVATLSARLSRSSRLRNARPFGWILNNEIPEGVEPTDPLPSEESVGSLFQPDRSGERPAGGGT
jgi:hypothetical protein